MIGAEADFFGREKTDGGEKQNHADEPGGSASEYPEPFAVSSFLFPSGEFFQLFSGQSGNFVFTRK